MKKCFLCLKSLRSRILQKRRRRPWLQNIQEHCRKNITSLGWCQIILQNYNIISEYEDAKNQVIREMRQTNISSQILKIINYDFNVADSSNDRQGQYKRPNNQVQSPFAFCIDLFTSYIQLKYGEIINPSKFTVAKIENQFHDFVQVMKKSIIQYYELEGRQLIGEDFYHFALGNYIIDKIFKCHGETEQFNNMMIKIQRDSDKDKNDRINFNIQKFKSSGIQQYGVSPIFQLNDNTLKHLSLNSATSLQKPYAVPIQLVKEIVKSKSPQQKLKNMQATAQQIEFSIHSFFKNQVKDPKIKKENVHLDAENALAILLYVIVQSGQTSLLPHLNLMKIFLNPSLKKSHLSVCIQGFQLCLQNLAKGNINLKNQQLMQPRHVGLCFDKGSYAQEQNNQPNSIKNLDGLGKGKGEDLIFLGNVHNFFEQTSNLEQ